MIEIASTSEDEPVDFDLIEAAVFVTPKKKKHKVAEPTTKEKAAPSISAAPSLDEVMAKALKRETDAVPLNPKDYTTVFTKEKKKKNTKSMNTPKTEKGRPNIRKALAMRRPAAKPTPILPSAVTSELAELHEIIKPCLATRSTANAAILRKRVHRASTTRS